MRRWIVGSVSAVAIVAVVAIVLVGGLPDGRGAANTPSPLPPIPPSTRVVAEARLVPRTWASVTVTAPGVVTRIAVAAGDTVPGGAIVVELDPTAAEAELAIAQAALDATTARTAQAEAVVAQAAAEVDRATAVLQAARAARDQLPSNASSARERAADAEVDAALAGLEAARAAGDAAAAAAEAAGADEARAAATFEAARTTLNRMRIRSPIAGVVADLPFREGEWVALGQPVARIAGDDGWRFETTDLTQDEVATIRIGSAATATIDGFASTPVGGRVAWIAGYGIDRQGDVVYTAVIEPDGELPTGVRWNMRASIEIAIAP